jgi:hypothetical protein
VFALACVAGLCAAVLASPGSASVPKATSTQGITKDQVQVVVLVADLDGLRSKGLDLPAKLTTGNLTQRWQGYFDALGPVNGRTIKVTPVTWDPLDPKSFDPACTKATQDNHPFAVMNANGYRQASVGCITVDNKVFYFDGESVYNQLQQASGKRLVSLGIPAEQSGTAAGQIVQKYNLFPKTTKFGILTGNDPAVQAAGETAEAALKKEGYTIVPNGVVNINIATQDQGAAAQDAAAAVPTLKAAGADTIIVTLPFTINGAFFQEAQKENTGWKYLLVDAASSLCTQFGASRTPTVVAQLGVPCVTTWDTRAVPAKNAVKKDNAFEAKCRATMDKTFNETTIPGVPSGDITDASGKTLTEDVAPNECQIAYLFWLGLKNAGKNPTMDSLYNSILKIKSAPGAYMSNGTGGFASGKAYFANQVHLEVLQAADTSTPKDANGLYNGCPAPVNCWVPVVPAGGSEWFPVSSK